ncbi:YceI family protein [Opitutus sp. ER46]|uniref:YceI family protein n=1 Tax=Opitutus sp. ER46 TaxID=2161864 RepID=UPI000D3087FE|nr:YceI family protein [Opitutus sp. ER46]PTX92675.1 hypothetical protein DB354_15240 [Opitutus sp. ER46]
MFPRFALLLVCLSPGVLHAGERPLAIDFAQSQVEVLVKATVDSFTGHLTRFEPMITVGDDGMVSHARLAFHFRDVDTGKPKRDEAMHEWQHTSEHPDGEFILGSLHANPDQGFTAAGWLTFHGVRRELSFPATVTKDGTLYAIDGNAAVDTREYGLPIIRMFGLLKVDPVVHVRFHVQGRLPASAATAAVSP